MHHPTSLHRQSVKRLLRYLKQTIHFGVQLKRSKSHSLQIYSDADWVGCRDDRCSTGGFCVFLGDNLISWAVRSKTLSLDQVLKRSTKLLQMQLERLNGCVLFFISLAPCVLFSCSMV